MSEAATSPEHATPPDETWDAPPRHEAGPVAAPVLAVDGWEGPLDWLLELVRSRRIDLAKLPIVGLVDAFATALETALARRGSGAVALGTVGDWLVMAATLTLLRSQLLLPRDDPAARAARVAAEALRRQLVDRAATASAADWLDRRSQLGRDVFARGRSAAEHERAGRVGDITGLFRACLVALEVPWDAAAAYRVPPLPRWTVAQATARIRQVLSLTPETTLGACLPNVPQDAADQPQRGRAALAATFCSSLELARMEQIGLFQAGPFATITVQVVSPPTIAAEISIP